MTALMDGIEKSAKSLHCTGQIVLLSGSDKGVEMLLAARIAIVIAALIVFTVIHIINNSYHLGAIP